MAARWTEVSHPLCWSGVSPRAWSRRISSASSCQCSARCSYAGYSAWSSTLRTSWTECRCFSQDPWSVISSRERHPRRQTAPWSTSTRPAWCSTTESSSGKRSSQSRARTTISTSACGTHGSRILLLNTPTLCESRCSGSMVRVVWLVVWVGHQQWWVCLWLECLCRTRVTFRWVCQTGKQAATWKVQVFAEQYLWVHRGRCSRASGRRRWLLIWCRIRMKLWSCRAGGSRPSAWPLVSGVAMLSLKSLFNIDN